MCDMLGDVGELILAVGGSERDDLRRVEFWVLFCIGERLVIGKQEAVVESLFAIGANRMLNDPLPEQCP